MARAVLGWRLWTGDGRVYDSKHVHWNGAPSTDIQYVTIYWDESYDIHIQDSYDEAGNPVNPRWVTEQYVTQLFGKDYYWIDSDGIPQTGMADDVPTNMPRGVVKRGRTMLDANWHALSGIAENVRTWPP